MGQSSRHRSVEDDADDGQPAGHAVRFDVLDEDDGLAVVDPIERQRYRLFTPAPVTPTDASTDELMFPVDAAVTVEADAVELPSVVATFVRDAEGEMLAEAEHFADESFERGTYTVELCAPVKLYLRVESSVHVTADAFRTRVTFGDEATVLVGARSHHERPAATVTTTTDPVDVMTAVSTFGSALKSTTPERSYPSLRGHPPLVELGEELDVPDWIEPPDTGVRIELPRELRRVFVAAPLAYYLGAEVVPGAVPRIVTDHGFEHRLDGPGGFETEVERVLKRTFLLDCVTRTEGIYRVSLHERAETERRADLDFEALYDRPLAEQLEAYLDVPYDTLADLVPDWKLTTHVAPTPENAELLPFVTNDLAVVRTPTSGPTAGSETQAAATADFLRTDRTAGAFTRSTATTDGPNHQFVRPEADDSLEQAWVGEGTPVGASKASREAHLNRLARAPDDGDIGITVVCNDARMAVERDIVEAVYGSREDLPFDVDVHYGLDVAELETVVRSETDFLHYIGHIDDAGFECADGRLDVRALDRAGPDSFLLNACQSYDQGRALVEAGSVAGIVTLSDVVNSGAVEMGRTLARLLNRGFPLRSALEIARGESAVGDQYIVVGDGGLSIAQNEHGTPVVHEIESTGEERYELTYKGYPNRRHGMGTMLIPYLNGVNEYYLSSGEIGSFGMSSAELRELLHRDEFPLRVNGRLAWSSETSIEDI
jgi:hypothetical protein